MLPIRCDDLPLVRPYLVAVEQQRERERERIRRTLLITASLETAVAL
jgi:hypothetical protein